MRFDLSNKTAIVTGASQGIGETIAIEIAKCGIPCKKFVVPSIGSIIQVFSLSLLVLDPSSSLIIE